MIGHGKLHRAYVSLPENMTERDRPLQERTVFFEAPSTTPPALHLVRLLALAWNVDTSDWLDRGSIYAVRGAYDACHDDCWLDASYGDLRLFASGSGGQWGVGVDRTHFCRAKDIDLFVTPKVAARLQVAIAEIECLYAAEPARRAQLAVEASR